MRTVPFYILLVIISVACNKEPFKETSRSFSMGVTPWPPDFSEQGEELAYSFINSKCDMVTHHFDDGVPWQEAYDSTAFPQEIIDNVNKRISRSHVPKTYLAIAPLSSSRKGIAGYWNKSADENIRKIWSEKPMNDTMVITAYFRFCCYMVDAFKPDYFNYAVECNSKDWEPAQFNEFVYFCSVIYSKLKARYPALPVFVSYMVTLDDGTYENAKRMNPYSDQISLSSYPYVCTGSFARGSTELTSIPENWFSKFREIDNSKPFSIAETGYIAEDLDISEWGVSKMGRPEWQADYLQYVFETCNTYHAEFVNWFCAYDYDNAYNTMLAAGVAMPLFKEWKDIGFYDGQGMARPSLTVWMKWYKAAKN